MPQRAFTIGGFTEEIAPAPLAPEAPSGNDILSAAFGLGNDMVAAYDLLTRPNFKEDPTFKLVETLKRSKYWDNYRDNFLGVKSQAEFNFTAAKIEDEEKKRDVLGRAGWAGTAAMVGAGLMSPTMFIPLTAGGRGAVAIGRGAVLGALAGGAQEIPLQLAQETRTMGETFTGLAASTILGGVFGGAVAYMTRAEREAIGGYMAQPGGGTAISRSVGAAEVTKDPGRLAPGARAMTTILDSNPITRSPVTDTLSSDFVSARIGMAQLGDAGMTLERNALGVPTAEGGTVENNVTVWHGAYASYVQSFDDAFSRYVFDGTPPTLGANIRAQVRAYMDTTKMSKNQFREEVWRALAAGDTHENPFVAEAAKAARETIYEPILKELQALKLLAEDVDSGASISYVNWLPNHEAIARDPVRFVDFLTERFNRQLGEQFATMWEKHTLKNLRDEEFLTDAVRTQQDIDDLRDKLGAQLVANEERMNAMQFSALEDTIAGLRAAARPLKDGNLLDETVRKQMLADARDMEKNAGPLFSEAKLERREIKRRLSQLNKATVVLEERLANKLGRIERAEELSETALMRVARKGQKILNELENWTDEKLDAELSKLKDDFERVAQQYDRGEERIAKIAKEEGDTGKLLGAEASQEGRAEKLTALTERIADAEDLGREAVRDLITNMLDETIKRVRGINDRRAVRTARLRQAAEDLHPDVVAQRLARVREGRSARARDFAERVRVMGGDLDEVAGKADFTEYARRQAFLTKDKFLGTMVRLPVVDMIQAERGAVLPRLLSFIPTQDMAPWLERDVDRVIRSHIRTMAPDIEIAKKFEGSVNAEPLWVRMQDELNARLDAVAKNEDMSEAAKQKETARLQAEFAQNKSNLETTIRRLRNQEGLPNNPDGMGYRMARVAMDLNVLRYMGGVLVASVADIGRPVARYGLTRTFRDGFLPFITRMKEMKMVRKEAQRAGVAVETIIHSRAYTVMDVMDDLHRGSKFERAVQYASGKQGIIAAFSIWTDAMKAITAGVSNAKIMDSIAEVMTESKPSKGAVEFLASNGIDGQLAQRIWSEVAAGGGGKVNGVWLPNTEAWKDGGAVQAYRAAVAREANNTIITPGLERPAWMTGSTVGRLVAQFRSFAFSSTYKTLGAGLQQRDTNFAQGVMTSLALGALSYYLYSVAAGGDRAKEMQNAGLDRWADEAWQRSGLAGAFGLAQDIASRIPATAPIASFSGGRTTRRGGDDIIETLGGPTFDAIVKSAQVVTGIDDPTAATVHTMRTLLPWQNITLLSRLFDALEAGTVETLDLPESRR